MESEELHTIAYADSAEMPESVVVGSRLGHSYAVEAVEHPNQTGPPVD